MDVPRLVLDLDLVKTAAAKIGRTGHRLEMRKADLGTPHRLDGLRQALQVLAYGDHVSGGSAGLVTFKTDPLDRRDKALLFVIRFGRKPGGHARSPQEQEIHVTEDQLELGSLLGAVNRRLHVLRREHRNRLPNICSIVKKAR